jgi:hypothetical protein
MPGAVVMPMRGLNHNGQEPPQLAGRSGGVRCGEFRHQRQHRDLRSDDPGLGDDAFVGAAGAIYAVKGDTEVTLQIIAFSDPKAQEHAVALAKLVLGKLP